MECWFVGDDNLTEAFARLITPVVTTIKSNKIQNEDILVPAYSDCSGKMAVNYGKRQMSIKVTCYASKHYTSLQYLVAPGHAYMCSVHCNVCSAAEKQFLQNALPNATNDSKQMSTKITTGLFG